MRPPPREKEGREKKEEGGHIPVRNRVVVRSRDIPQLKATVCRGRNELVLIHLTPGAVVKAFLREEISALS